MLEQARQNLAGASFVVGDLYDLPVPTGSVDLATNALALTHVEDLGRVLAEFARILRPGGTAVISDVHPDLVALGSAVKAEGPSGQPQLAACHRHTVADYLRAALSAGFRIRGFDEQTRIGQTHDEPTPEPVREIGTWREWPWTLLEWVPEASRAAWDIPATIVWHLELESGDDQPS